MHLQIIQIYTFNHDTTQFYHRIFSASLQDGRLQSNKHSGTSRTNYPSTRNSVILSLYTVVYTSEDSSTVTQVASFGPAMSAGLGFVPVLGHRIPAEDEVHIGYHSLASLFHNLTGQIARYRGFSAWCVLIWVGARAQIMLQEMERQRLGYCSVIDVLLVEANSYVSQFSTSATSLR